MKGYAAADLIYDNDNQLKEAIENSVPHTLQEVTQQGNNTTLPISAAQAVSDDQLPTLAQVRQEIGSSQEGDIEFVDVLPETGVPGTIYAVPTSDPGIYQKWVWKDGEWVDFGTTAMNLANYYTKTQVDNITSQKVNTSTKVAGKPLTGDVNLTATDVGAAPTIHTHNMNDITDAATATVEPGEISRKVIVQQTKRGNGYVSRMALGLTNPASRFSPAIFSVGRNDSGTSWRDFIFDIDGSLTVEGGFVDNSDDRLKNYLGDVKIDWDALRSIPVRYYHLKKDESTKVQIGTSAQKVEKVCPELVKDDLNGHKALNYGKLSLLFLPKLIELKDEIDKLTLQVKCLQNQTE